MRHRHPFGPLTPAAAVGRSVPVAPGGTMNTRSIAVIALIIAVIVLLVVLL
jgi:hypothetical protein